jgi:hypothetical protein
MDEIVYAKRITFLDREIVSTNDLASYLKLKPNTLQKWRGNNQGPLFLKVGGKVLYRTSDIRKWLENSLRQNSFSNIIPFSACNQIVKDLENAKRKTAV